jgi:hypothetical protein
MAEGGAAANRMGPMGPEGNVMRMWRGGLASSVFAILAIAVITPDAGASPIAQVTNIVNSAFRSPPGESELPVKVSDELVQDEALRTETDSTVELNFIDGSQMSLEPESELVLSKYVFDPEGKQTAAIIDLQAGTFHYKSNGTPDQDVVLKTPVATIGIRGTELLIHVVPSATIPNSLSLTVDVIDGLIDVQPEGKGKGASAEAGQSVNVKGPNADATVGDIGDVATAAGAPPSSSTSAEPSDDDKERDGPSADKKSDGPAGAKGDARPD